MPFQDRVTQSETEFVIAAPHSLSRRVAIGVPARDSRSQRGLGLFR